MAQRTALIDGDTIIYEAARPAEKIVDWGDGIVSWYADLYEATPRFMELVKRIADGMNADRVIVALSDYSETNWRRNVLPTYKDNRSDKRRPLAWASLRETCEQEFETFIRPTLEGDDVLGILLTHPTLVTGEKIVVSIDKDMKTLPGLHSNFNKERNEFGNAVFEQSIEAADRFHLLQALMGDTTDGYSGCPGIGAVTGAKILEPYCIYDGEDLVEFDTAEAWKAVVRTFETKGLTADDALVQARVARICRHTEYDFKAKEVRLWEPPK